MNNLVYSSKSLDPASYGIKVVLYTLLLLLVQIVWVARLPYHALRIDLLLPLMFGVALHWSPLPSLLWAALLGFIMDVLSGSFWGFHVGSYVVVVCLVNVAVERFEFHNPIYQMGFVGICALGQSMALGCYLSFSGAAVISVTATWTSLGIRAAIMTVLAPFILYPIWNSTRSIWNGTHSGR
jgi:rod shape-determining protein MreD